MITFGSPVTAFFPPHIPITQIIDTQKSTKCCDACKPSLLQDILINIENKKSSDIPVSSLSSCSCGYKCFQDPITQLGYYTKDTSNGRHVNPLYIGTHYKKECTCIDHILEAIVDELGSVLSLTALHTSNRYDPDTYMDLLRLINEIQ